jgi:hypothetical protein
MQSVLLFNRIIVIGFLSLTFPFHGGLVHCSLLISLFAVKELVFVSANRNRKNQFFF